MNNADKTRKPRTTCEQLESDIRNATIGMWFCAAAIIGLFCALFLWETPRVHAKTMDEYMILEQSK